MDKNDHLVKWEEVCRSKAHGGLEIGSLKERNIALLLKWFCRFSTERDSLWHSIIWS